MYRKALKTCIIICWCLLAVCMVFKLCGSKVCEIAVGNGQFIKVCNWLDSDGLWCNYVLSSVMSTTSTTFLMLAAGHDHKPTWKHLLLILCTIIPIWVVKIFSSIAGFVLDCVSIIVVPAILSKNWWAGFVGLALNVAFQTMSMFVRGIDMGHTFDNNTILSLVFSIDYYIMIALYFLYVSAIKTKKEEHANGTLGNALDVGDSSAT